MKNCGEIDKRNPLRALLFLTSLHFSMAGKIQLIKQWRSANDFPVARAAKELLLFANVINMNGFIMHIVVEGLWNIEKDE
jgi:hypothetical protein